MTILVTIIVGLLTATATIVAAVITTRTPKREIHEVVFRGFGEAERLPGPFASIIRGVGSTIVWLMVFIGLNLITMPAFLWMDPTFDPEIDTSKKKLLTAFFFVSAALLFCISRWLYNRLPAVPRPDDNDDDDDD